MRRLIVYLLLISIMTPSILLTISVGSRGNGDTIDDDPFIAGYFLDTETDFALNDISWDPQGEICVVATGMEGIRIIHLVNQSILEVEGGSFDKVVWSPDDEYIAILPLWGSSSTIRIMETRSWEIINEIGLKGAGTSLDFSPNGTFLSVSTTENEVEIIDMRDLDRKITLKGHDMHILDLAWSQDGSRLATCSNDDRILIWDTGSWDIIQDMELEFEGEVHEAMALDWDITGDVLLCGTEDGYVATVSSMDWSMIDHRNVSSREVDCIDVNDDGLIAIGMESEFREPEVYESGAQIMRIDDLSIVAAFNISSHTTVTDVEWIPESNSLAMVTTSVNLIGPDADRNGRIDIMDDRLDRDGEDKESPWLPVIIGSVILIWVLLSAIIIMLIIKRKKRR